MPYEEPISGAVGEPFPTPGYVRPRVPISSAPNLSGLDFTGDPHEVAAFDQFGAHALLAHQSHQYQRQRDLDHIDNQSRLHQIQLTQAENMHRQRLEAQVAAVRADSRLAGHEQQEMITHIMSGLSPLQMRIQEEGRLRAVMARTAAQQQIENNVQTFSATDANGGRHTYMITPHGHERLPDQAEQRAIRDHERTMADTAHVETALQRERQDFQHSDANIGQTPVQIQARMREQAPHLLAENHEATVLARLRARVRINAQIMAERQGRNAPGQNFANGPGAGNGPTGMGPNLAEGGIAPPVPVAGPPPLPRPRREDFPNAAEFDANMLMWNHHPRGRLHPANGGAARVEENTPAADALDQMRTVAREHWNAQPFSSQALAETSNNLGAHSPLGHVGALHDFLRRAVLRNRDLNPSEREQYAHLHQELLDLNRRAPESERVPENVTTGLRLAGHSLHGSAEHIQTVLDRLVAAPRPADQGMAVPLTGGLLRSAQGSDEHHTALASARTILERAARNGRGLTSQERRRYAALIDSLPASFGRVKAHGDLPEANFGLLPNLQ